MRFVSVVLLIAAGTAGCSPAGPAGPVDRLAWASCGDRVECATLTVEGFDLAVARRPARDHGHRIGALVMNPGGPGASGVAFVKNGQPAPLGERFDLVSWDPRGIGASDAVDCDGPAPAYRDLDWSPDDPAETAALDDAARAIAEGCGQRAGARLGHLSTGDAAGDLEALRVALGEDKVTFLGFSYGTAIGLAYAERFGDRVRAMALDGVVDPHDDLGSGLAAQAAEFDKGLGPDLAAAYDEVARRVEAAPMTTASGPVGPTTVAYAAIGASYGTGARSALERALNLALRGDGEAVRTLADGYWTGASYSSYLAVVCTDLPHPTGGPGYDGLVARLTAVSPRFGAAVANELRPCAFWPAPVTGRPGPVRAASAPPILVLGATGDVATPYAASERVAGELAHGTLLTRVGAGHTSYGNSACISTPVDRYLIDLVLPPAGTRC